MYVCLQSAGMTPCSVFSPVSGGPVLAQPFSQMQVQQLIPMKKTQHPATIQAAAAAQQKAGLPQQGQAAGQQKVITAHLQPLSNNQQTAEKHNC